MDEIEEKYKRFNLKEDMRELFGHPSVDIDGHCQRKESFVVTTIVIDNTVESVKAKENKDAKLG